MSDPDRYVVTKAEGSWLVECAWCSKRTLAADKRAAVQAMEAHQDARHQDELAAHLLAAVAGVAHQRASTSPLFRHIQAEHNPSVAAASDELLAMHHAYRHEMEGTPPHDVPSE